MKMQISSCAPSVGLFDLHCSSAVVVNSDHVVCAPSHKRQLAVIMTAATRRDYDWICNFSTSI